MKQLPILFRQMGPPKWLPLLLTLLGLTCELMAQQVEKDSTEWVGEWRDEGANLQYAYRLKLHPLGDGKMKGVFEWRLIWTSLPDHRSKVGAMAREFVVGRYNAAERGLDLVGMRHEDPADIISMDHYLLTVSEDGKRLEGINIKPTNYHGSMFGVKQIPKKKPVQQAPLAAKNVSVKPMAGNAAKNSVKPSGSPAPAVPPKPSTPMPREGVTSVAKTTDAELNSRDIVTKSSVKATATEVKVLIHDESLIDGDVVSLNWNGAWVLRYYKVAHAPKELVLPLLPGENTLVMHAENLGKYPPNTASITLQHGTKTQQMILNSDMGKSEAIKIVRE